MQHGFDIQLLEDCVLSSRNATVGGHQCLDHVPGSALLGIAASSLYRSLSTQQAFMAFHSGALRFGYGLPLHAGQVALPMPLAWHRYKNADIEDQTHRLLPERLVNRLFGYAGEEQIKSLREGFVTASGHWLRPLRAQRMKTAVNADTGRAADSQLFGYQALRRGQTFRAVLEADDGFDADLFERVCQALEGERLLGRSRSGEYGRGSIGRIKEVHGGPTQRAPEAEGGKQRHFLWLLADLAPHDAMGCPTNDFDPRALGLGDVQVDFAHSFARMRSYSPWNAARRGHDQERSVWVAGSVLCLLGPAPDSSVLARGLGLYREQGLGRVCLDPALLATARPQWQEAPAAVAERSREPAKPHSPLLDWLHQAHQQAHDNIDKWVDEKADLVSKTLRDARRLAGVPEGQNFGPSRSQWSRVQQAASRHTEADALRKALFDDNSGVIRKEGEGWNVSLRHAGQWTNLATWFDQQFEEWQQDSQTGAQLPRHVRHLAHRLRNQTGSR